MWKLLPHVLFKLLNNVTTYMFVIQQSWKLVLLQSPFAMSHASINLRFLTAQSFPGGMSFQQATVASALGPRVLAYWNLFQST